MKNYAVILFASILLLGCSNKTEEPSGSSVVSMSQAEAQALEADKAADQLTDIAEGILASRGLEYIKDVKKVLDQALTFKPEHEKANFYNSLVVLSLANEGILAKAEASQDVKDTIKRHNFPGLFSFTTTLPSGSSQTIKNYSDIQKHLSNTLLPSILEASQSLSYVSMGKATEIINSEIFQSIGDKNKKNINVNCSKKDEAWQCEKIVQEEMGEFTVKNQRVVDSIDLEILRGALDSIANGIRLVTAYKLEGMEDFVTQLKQARKNKKLTDEDVVNLLWEYPSLLELDNDNKLMEISGSLDQTLRSALDLYTLRSEICPKMNRSVNLLNSICLSVEDARGLEVALEALSGPSEMTLGKDQYGQAIRITVNASAFLNASIGDFKDLLPSHFDDSGKAIDYNDPTMGGVFPEGDFVEKIKKVNK